MTLLLLLLLLPTADVVSEGGVLEESFRSFFGVLFLGDSDGRTGHEDSGTRRWKLFHFFGAVVRWKLASLVFNTRYYVTQQG